MNLRSHFDSPFQVQLCFDKIIGDLERKASDEMNEYAYRSKILLKEIKDHPEFLNGINDATQIDNNPQLVRRLLADYFPPSLTRNEIKAVNIPYTNLFFNHTERFSNIIKNAGPGFDINIRDLDEHQFYVLSCCIILNNYYHKSFDFSKPIFYDIPTASGIVKHYRILYNADFLDILPTAHTVGLTDTDIDLLMDNYDNLSLWKEKFPPASWIMKGFAIISLFDATNENAVSSLKEKLLGLNIGDFRQSFGSIFQSIFQERDIQVGFTLFNNEASLLSRESFGPEIHSFILHYQQQFNAYEMLGERVYNELILKKDFFAVSDSSLLLAQSEMVRCFTRQGIQSFILAPVVKHGKILGILEIVSNRIKVLNSINAHKLEVLMPFLTDTIERLVFQVENQVLATIQEYYTSIHSSVHWRFREEAEKFIYNLQQDNKYELKEIIFDDIYPLYGQVDIQNSSDVRNSCLQKDLAQQLKAMLVVLEAVNHSNLAETFFQEVYDLTELYMELEQPLKTDSEQRIHHYLDDRISPRLKAITNPELVPLIKNYFRDTDKDTGLFHKNRRNYEKTIQSINRALVSVIDKMQNVAQAQFPHYFERFKTDGVEHNLYIGASIAPTNGFSLPHLHNLRLWQLRVACEMENVHHNLKASLPMQLEVRSLVLVFHSTVAIRYRMDEKRFDVDGSYNTRFEIIKKRIDKACIKNTTERITQSGKICIVYSNVEEQQEYLEYLQTLHLEGLVAGRPEIFEVEDLPGVTGLRGMRTTILFR